MTFPLRRWLPWSLLLALVAGLWIGWAILRTSIERWALEEHRLGDWVVQVYGGSLASWRVAHADSIRVRGPGADILLTGLGIDWSANDSGPAHRFPIHVRIALRNALAVIGQVDGTSSSAPPAFPATLRFPVSFSAFLDTLRIVKGDSLDVRVDGIRLEARGPSALSAGWRDARMAGIPAWSSGSAELDWGRDSLRGRLLLALSSGCCARDSAALSFSADFRDLTAGRGSLTAGIESLSGWSDLMPGIVHAPVLDGVRLQVDATRPRGGFPAFEARLGFASGPYLFLPGLEWGLRVASDSNGSVVELDADGSVGQKVSVRLASAARFDSALDGDLLAGSAEVRGIGYTLLEQSHPFDGEIEIRRIGLKGGEGVVRLASGSVVDGGAVWKGLHWHCDGVIAANEPWAIRWVPGIALGEGSRVWGKDSAGTAFFQAHAVGPRYRWFVGDSMDVSVHLNTKRIAFPSISLERWGRKWIGEGSVDWTLRGYAFSLESDSGAGLAKVEGDFTGWVKADAGDFPIQHLPVDLELARLPYQVLASATFERKPPSRSDSAAMSLVARMKALQGGDSIAVEFDAFQQGRMAEIRGLRLSLGDGHVQASAGAFQDSIGWSPSFVKAKFNGVDLERFSTIWPGLPGVRGRIEGDLAISRKEGVSARAEVGGLAFKGKDGWTKLPDLVVWGGRDTLNLGGRWPVGRELDPFRLTLTRLFERDLGFELLAFHGDIVRLRGRGVLENRSRLHATFLADGGIAIPGTDARLDDLLVDGEIRGANNPDGFDWSASLEGKQGMLRAIKGLPLQSRFLLRAEPGVVYLDSLSLRGEKAGEMTFQGRYDIPTHIYTGVGRARDFRLDLGEGKNFHLGSMDLVAGSDQRLRASLSGLTLEQTWGRGEGLWVDVDKADLILVQAKDWRKLQGTAQVRKLLYTRNIADLGSLTRSVLGRIEQQKEERKGPKTESVPLLLDIRAWGGGDSIRVDNNLARASLAFDIQATGPVEALLLNGTVDANPEGSTFGYGGKTFGLDELHVDWNVAPPKGGRYALAGSRSVLQTCPDATKASSSLESSDSCSLKLASQGTLAEPRMYPLTTDCGSGGADEGAVLAALALARDCYPSDGGKGTNTIGGSARSAAIDLGVQQGMGYVNDAIRVQLERQRREGRIFLPDSIALTDVPIGETRDQLGLLAFYRLSDDMDAEGEYRHAFLRNSTTKGATVLADDYSLRLRWRPPLEWIQESRIRERLKDHLVFQVEFGQSLDSRSQREMTVSPSLRYRWEFW